MMPFDDGGLLLSWPLRSFDNSLAIFRACRARPHRDKLTEAEMETGADILAGRAGESWPTESRRLVTSSLFNGAYD